MRDDVQTDGTGVHDEPENVEVKRPECEVEHGTIGGRALVFSEGDGDRRCEWAGVGFAFDGSGRRSRSDQLAVLDGDALDGWNDVADVAWPRPGLGAG